MKRKRTDRGGSHFKLWLLIILLTAVIVPSVWFFLIRMESTPPRIELDIENGYLNARAAIPVRLSDEKSGIRKYRASLTANGKELLLEERDYHAMGAIPPFHVDLTLEIDPQNPDIADGAAVIRIEATDDSWRDWLSGNRTQIEKRLIIDTAAPRITVLSHQHNVSRGGAGLVIYRLSETCPRHGIVVGDEFFPGHSGYFEDPNLYLAFFALTHEQGPGTDLHAEAVDPAGNLAKSGFYHHIRDRHFKSETLTISDAFLDRILPGFQQDIPVKPDASPVEQFQYVNRELRGKNNRTLLQQGKGTDNRMHWEGPFLRLPNAALKASYADSRTYSHNGETIGHAAHLGIDLASLQQAPVPAANHGRVVLADHVGIYGLTVILDHGFGLFSLYSHLSRTNVNPGDRVKKGDAIGNTGTTGLAGGDHLHYGMFIDHVFVDPVEWWDPSWIKNNVAQKLQEAKPVSAKVEAAPVP